MAPDEIENQKRVEYYSASVHAWFNTSMEYDKSLLGLSAGAIGLLLTLLTTVGLSSAEALVLYIGAIVCFVVTLVAILVVFRRNRTYIEKILSGESRSTDALLTILDITVLWAFGIGVMFTAIIGISTAIHSYSTKEKTMADEATKNTETVPLRESFNGASKLLPSKEFTKSFNGAAKLQPQTPASTTAPVASSPASAPASSTQEQSGTGK